jgi:predicted transcriptional regulator
VTFTCTTCYSVVMAKSVGLNKGGKRNLTVQLDEETIQAAKELAVRRHTSVSGLLTRALEELVAADTRYREAMRLAIDAMYYGEKTLGGRATWSRDELYEEMFNE